MRFKKEFQQLIPFYLFYVILTLAMSRNFFFWDTVQLASKHAHWYFDNHFRYLLLPDSIDSGHIPSFGFLLAAVWEIFQKSLLVSHLMMLPFLLGIVWQAHKLLTHFFSKENVFYALIILLIDPTLLSQSILVSPDVILVFLFLFTLNQILRNNRKLILMGAIGLSLISMRGMMTAAVLFVFDAYVNFNRFKGGHAVARLVHGALAYVPAGLITLAYLLYHYEVKGWVGYHDNSPWALCFQRVGFSGFLYNIGIYAWRLIDFGRIVLWLILMVVLITLRKKITPDDRLKELMVLLASLIFLFPMTMLLHKNLLAHRYLLPVYLVFSMVVCYMSFELSEKNRIKKYLFGIMALGLLTGNLWVYPDQVAKGWDATLAHVPYYHLRNNMISYIDQQKIPYADIGTAFPNVASSEFVDLNQDHSEFAEKDFSKNRYIFYSNIMNDFTDEELSLLQHNWIAEKEYKFLQVRVILYKNPASPL
jgi:hypothetical protein